jgi:CheY-like chemotaxis protein
MLLDLHMPVVDGLEVLATVKGRLNFNACPL